MREIAVYVSFMNDQYRRMLDSAAERLGFRVTYYNSPADGEALAARIGDYEVIYGHPAPALLKEAGNLRWLCNDFAGIEPYLDPAVWPRPDCMLSNSSGSPAELRVE